MDHFDQVWGGQPADEPCEDILFDRLLHRPPLVRLSDAPDQAEAPTRPIARQAYGRESSRPVWVKPTCVARCLAFISP
jgi:hypothetical protein